jgi:hypothetical protein
MPGSLKPKQTQEVTNDGFDYASQSGRASPIDSSTFVCDPQAGGLIMEIVIHSIPTIKGKVIVTERREVDKIQYLISGPLDKTPDFILTHFPKEMAIGLAESRARAQIAAGK